MIVTKEQVMEIAFQIIGYAGEAFDYFNQAALKAEESNFEEAEALVKEGKNSLKEAHKAQMDLIVAEAREEEIPYSLTMTHAQDHLMNAVLMETTVRHLIAVAKMKL